MQRAHRVHNEFVPRGHNSAVVQHVVKGSEGHTRCQNKQIRRTSTASHQRQDVDVVEDSKSRTLLIEISSLWRWKSIPSDDNPNNMLYSSFTDHYTQSNASKFNKSRYLIQVYMYVSDLQCEDDDIILYQFVMKFTDMPTEERTVQKRKL